MLYFIEMDARDAEMDCGLVSFRNELLKKLEMSFFYGMRNCETARLCCIGFLLPIGGASDSNTTAVDLDMLGTTGRIDVSQVLKPFET
jgi:hypothetical protein